MEEARDRLDSEDRPAKPSAVARAAKTVGPRVKTTRGLVKAWPYIATSCHVIERVTRHTLSSIRLYMPRH